MPHEAHRAPRHPGDTPALRHAWAFSTRSRVTWREAMEGSAVMSIGLVAAGLGAGAVLLVRRARARRNG